MLQYMYILVKVCGNMEIQEIKEYIINNDKIEDILEELGCHHIRLHNHKYYSCGFPDGDNVKSINLYLDTLQVKAYTRNIEDKYGNSDIVSLVCFIKDLYFSKALKWICDVLGLNYYDNNSTDIPLSLQVTRMLIDMSEVSINSEEKQFIKPVNENVLATYYTCCNKMFKTDGVDYLTQQEFELGIDLNSERITIPIRDELGTLVGVKGRATSENYFGDKYIYLEPCAKTKVLYGLYKTLEFIKEKDEIIIVESEKSVMILWANGIKNAVAIGGHTLSKTQVEKITRIGVSNIVICYDQDVFRLENGKVSKSEYKKEAEKFIEQLNVTAMVDINGTILNKKESPVDNMNIFFRLYNNKKRI